MLGTVMRIQYHVHFKRFNCKRQCECEIDVNICFCEFNTFLYNKLWCISCGISDSCVSPVSFYLKGVTQNMITHKYVVHNYKYFPIEMA